MTTQNPKNVRRLLLVSMKMSLVFILMWALLHLLQQPH